MDIGGELTPLADHAFTDLPQIPVGEVSGAWAERLVISPNASAMLVEQFRRLAATLYHAQGAHQLKTVMITSASQSDGKTLTAINLALTLSESYRRRVLLIDADLRRPSIHTLCPIAPTAGLRDALEASENQKLSVVQLTSRLTLLPAGRPYPDPMSGLTSARMREILSQAAAAFDWVILDAPPIGPIADAALLAGLTDAVLFVVRAAVTPCQAVQKALEAIGRDRVFGVVLNAVTENNLDQYGYYAEDRPTKPAVP